MKTKRRQNLIATAQVDGAQALSCKPSLISKVKRIAKQTERRSMKTQFNPQQSS
jgi:hypothetical protein